MKNKIPKSLRKQLSEIIYPCIWSYTIIGEDRQSLREAILTACAPNPVQIVHSHTSSGGKYHSMEARLEVLDEAGRLALFARLQTHPAIKIIL